MIRSVLAIAAGLLCGMYGMRLSASLRQEALVARRWVELLARLELLVGESVLSLPDALNHAADGASLPDRLLQHAAQALRDDPLTSLKEAFARLCPACPGQDALLRLFDRLGRGSAANRQLALQQAGEAMQLVADQTAERAARDAKLYATLGWTGGACLTILLL